VRLKSEILAELNGELPPYDWAEGAKVYLDGFFKKYTRHQIEDFVGTKPLSAITPEDPAGSIAEIVGYLENFSNAVKFLQLPRGARILDVACGPGWVSHWLTRLGYETEGWDISADFIALAIKRMQEDPYVALSEGQVAERFRVLDLERDPLPAAVAGRFEVAILESCLHHFFDPIEALSKISQSLSPTGVVLIIEGENRTGDIRPEYMDVMHETHTLERPYPRRLLREILAAAGLVEVEFLAPVNGYFPASAPLTRQIDHYVRDRMEGMNVCLCAATAEAIRRYVPSYGSALEGDAQPVGSGAPAAVPSIADQIAIRLRAFTPTPVRAILRPVGRALLPWARRMSSRAGTRSRSD
jgi:SAM-dependent methyltransferase